MISEGGLLLNPKPVSDPQSFPTARRRLLLPMDHAVATFLDDLDGAAFFDIHLSHSFKNFRNAEHPFDSTGIACICSDKACIKIPPLMKIEMVSVR